MISFHTGYYEKGIIIKDKKLIAIKYIKTALLSDILVQIPLFCAYYLEEGSSNSFVIAAYVLELFIFLKLFSLTNTFSRLERVCTENQTIAEFFPLVTLIVQILVMAHIVGLMYHMCAEIQIQYYQETKTWLHITNMIDHGWLDKYIHSLYWSISTMVTVLLYLPETKIDTIFAIVSIFLMTGVFGYALNLIGIIITDMNKQKKEYNIERKIANRLFTKRKITEKLRERVSLYLEFAFEQQKEKNQDEEIAIIEKLSNQLKKEIMSEINLKYLQKFDFLIKNFSKETQNEILQIIHEVNYSPDDIIVKQIEQDNQYMENIDDQENCIYVVGKGKVEQYVTKDSSSNNHIVRIIKENGVFGIDNFFKGNQLNYSIKSLESCLILKIKRTDFVKIISKNQEDYQKFIMIKDQFQELNTSDYIVNQCRICKKEGHQIIACPYTHFIYSKDDLMFNYKQQQKQNRQSYDRCNLRTENTLYNLIEYNDYLQDFLEDNDLEEYIQNSLNSQQFYQHHIDIIQNQNKAEEQDKHKNLLTRLITTNIQNSQIPELLLQSTRHQYIVNDPSQQEQFQKQTSLNKKISNVFQQNDEKIPKQSLRNSFQQQVNRRRSSVRQLSYLKSIKEVENDEIRSKIDTPQYNNYRREKQNSYKKQDSDTKKIDKLGNNQKIKSNNNLFKSQNNNTNPLFYSVQNNIEDISNYDTDSEFQQKKNNNNYIKQKSNQQISQFQQNPQGVSQSFLIQNQLENIQNIYQIEQLQNQIQKQQQTKDIDIKSQFQQARDIILQYQYTNKIFWVNFSADLDWDLLNFDKPKIFKCYKIQFNLNEQFIQKYLNQNIEIFQNEKEDYMNSYTPQKNNKFNRAHQKSLRLQNNKKQSDSMSQQNSSFFGKQQQKQDIRSNNHAKGQLYIKKSISNKIYSPHKQFNQIPQKNESAIDFTQAFEFENIQKLTFNTLGPSNQTQYFKK